ncbi:M24 family metallopeptidase [Pseudomonas putida]|uniref:Creatinase n=1 Tax=Pseudomonas putida TaxID=303 RepID=A0A379KRF8_PSEPU|nr:M24 family metallopeptidase [Pseudomonas putida]SUD70075.1 creatinase [Pseudomonas putida]
MQMPQTLKIRNGNKAKPTFSAQEYAARHARLRAYMAEQDIEAAIFTSYHNVNYYSDFLYCSFGRPYALVVTHDKVVSISANIDGGQPWRRTVGTDNIVYTDWQRDNYFVAIQQALPLASRIGVEYDHLNLQNHAKLAACYPRAELLDIGAPCMRMRMIKSAEEQALIRHGARVADIGGAAVVEALQDQVPEYEVALHATQAMIREIARSFPDSELMDTWTWFQSGLNTDGAHNPVTSRKVNPGDILSLNCFPMIAGYYTALERTLFLGHCPDEHLRLWQANVEVHEAGLKLVRPGMRCCDIARELNEIFLRHDLLQYRTFGYGHSFGTLSHYYGREAGLELREDIDTVLEPGMVVSIEPMIMLPEGLPGAGGYREHDILIVNETGAENITKFPYGPERNIIRK